jgi:hypothetical protein
MAPRKNNKGKKKAKTVEDNANIEGDGVSEEENGGMAVRNTYLDWRAFVSDHRNRWKGLARLRRQESTRALRSTQG